MSFNDEELAYLSAQPLGRLATVSSDGQPDVVPVGFQIEGPYIYIGGYDLTRTRKYHNVRDGNRKVALTVDDVPTTNPWSPRFVRIYGVADIVERDGAVGPGQYIRIAPTVSWSWNLAGEPLIMDGPHKLAPPRKATHQPPA